MADAALDRCRETVAAGGLSPHRRMPDIRQTNERFATAANKGSLTTAIRQCGLSRRPLLRLETVCSRSFCEGERRRPPELAVRPRPWRTTAAPGNLPHAVIAMPDDAMSTRPGATSALCGRHVAVPTQSGSPTFKIDTLEAVNRIRNWDRPPKARKPHNPTSARTQLLKAPAAWSR